MRPESKDENRANFEWVIAEMNITYIVGFIGALAVMIVGMMFGSDPASGSF